MVAGDLRDSRRVAAASAAAAELGRNSRTGGFELLRRIPDQLAATDASRQTARARTLGTPGRAGPPARAMALWAAHHATPVSRQRTPAMKPAPWVSQRPHHQTDRHA